MAEKDKRYDEALERARNIHTQTEFDCEKVLVEKIFPELRESDDERIRKDIIEYLKQRKTCYSEPFNSWITWLEKQGVQKPVENAEPKFNDGDWIVSEDGKTWLINGIDSKNYQVISIDGEHSYFPIIKQSSMHLWSIADAKKGDVLASKDGDDILIFRNIDSNTHFSSYNNIKGKSGLNWANSCFIPATKEQRDALEKAISNAGYKWDTDKMGLKKIEQNPAWSDDDERYMIDILAMLKSDISDSSFADLQNWFKTIKDRVSSKDKSTNIN